MKIYEFIEKEADKAIYEIKKNGYLSGGKNGPYDDNETPYRICSHWIIIFSWLFRNTKKDVYYNQVRILAEYIFEEQKKYKDYRYCCRNKEKKDHVNGTIGAAWIIEGLIEASKCLKNDKFYELAVKIFLAYPFNKKLGIWNRYEIDGSVLGYDETFNHQLWFAAAGAVIVQYKNNFEIQKQVENFLNHCDINNNLFRVRNDGVICHYLKVNDTMKHRLRFLKLSIIQKIKELLKKPNMRYKEEGYHYFALYAFGILKNVFPQHKIFNNKKIKKAIKYALNEKNYLRQLNRNPEEDGTNLAKKIKNNMLNIYCFPYNSPTYELPYIVKTFENRKEIDKIIDKLWEIQKNATMNNKYELIENVEDSKTLVARSYEILRAL